MDTSIINIIRNSAIVQHKNGTQPHLINVYTGHLLASYVDGRWEATTGEIKLNISCLDLDNLTDMDIAKGERIRQMALRLLSLHTNKKGHKQR